MSKIRFFVAVMASMSVASTASAQTSITYVGQQQVGSIFASYSLTTNGASGNLLDSSNITSYRINLSDSSLLSYELTNLNSSSQGFFVANTTSLSASRTSLIFNSFGFTNNFALLGSFGVGSGGTFAQVAAGSSSVVGESTAANSPFARVVAPISATPAVPEPATWAMMILGFSSIGCALRRRRKITARFSYTV